MKRFFLISAIAWMAFVLLGYFHNLPLLKTLPPVYPALIPGIKYITDLGSPGCLTFFTILLVLFIGVGKKDWRFSLIIIVLMLGGNLLMDLLKNYFAVPRPPLPHFATVSGYSFPSGHALMSTLFYGILALVLDGEGYKHISRFWWIVPLLVGISRPLLHVHYPGDVLAGWSAGIGWLYLVLALYTYWQPKSGYNISH